MSDVVLRHRFGAEALPVRRITFDEIRAALGEGFADFMAKPSHVIFLSIIYPIAGLVIARAAVVGDLLPLLFPLVAGFAILGPLAAVGTYEVSRRRETGADTSWTDLRDLVRSPEIRQIAGMAAILLAIFVAWLGAAQAIYGATLGPEMPRTLGDFARDVLTTSPGWAMILIGNIVGFAFAAAAFTVGLVSFPLIIDRKVGVGVAIRTSARCVAANPLVLAGWGAIVALALMGGMVVLFVGLAVVLPVLGHTSWHLYRKLVP